MYPPGGYCRSLLLFTTLSLTFHLPHFWSLQESCHCYSGRGGKWEKKRAAVHPQYCVCLFHSQTSFIPLGCGPQSSGCLCSALNAPLKLCWEVVLAPPSFACFYVGSSFSSQPSSLTAFPLHPRVIKRATCLPLSPLVFFLSSFHFFVPMNLRCECLGWHIFSIRTRVNYWVPEKWGYISFIKLSLHGLF